MLPSSSAAAGAQGYVPLCFVLPCVMWLQTRRGSLRVAEAVACVLVIALSLVVAVLSAVGSVRSLIDSSGSYAFFS